MPSQFTSIGFNVSTGEELAALASAVADRAETIDAPEGQYLKWTGEGGEQLWLQVKRSGDAMGMTPHFNGMSRVPALLEARVSRQTHTPLDGTYLAWADPASDSPEGRYPFVFDCPDSGTHGELNLPATVLLQVAAFAQRLQVYPSESAYLAAQQAEQTPFPVRSFIPSGLVTPSGEPVSPPEPHALLSGLIAAAEMRRNTVSGQPFWWALVESLGGTFDVVADPSLVPSSLAAGQVVSGWFWLSARLRIEEPTKRRSWLRTLIGT